MNTQNLASANRKSGAITVGLAILASLAALFIVVVLALVIGVTGIFRLSSETAALRSSVMNSVPGTWDKKIALRVGWLSTGIVRAGSRFFEMPPEPRAVLDGVHGAEVGIYQLRQEMRTARNGAALNAADKAMKSHGWDRIVGVATERELVAVYCPRKISSRAVKCCVLVFQGRELIVASASGNLESLFDLAREHISVGELKRQLSEGM